MAKQSPKPALVTGATGMVGTALARSLSQDGIPVRALVRESSDTTTLRDLDVDLYVGDVTDADSLTIPMDGVDTVYHCAAFVGDWGPAETFREVNVDGTANVAAAAVEAGARRLVHVSSIAVYGKTPGIEMTEAMPYTPCGDPYFDTKIEAEQAAFAVEDEIEVTAIRPTVIYGPGDRFFLPRLIKTVKRVPIPKLLGRGDAVAPFVYVENVVSLARAVAEHPAAVGQAFNCRDADSMLLEKALQLISTTAGGRQPFGFVLPQAAELTATALETVWKTAGISSAPPLTHFVLAATTMPRAFSIEKAKWLLDWEPTFSMRDGLLTALDEMGYATGGGGAAAPTTADNDDWGEGWDEDDDSDED